MWATFGNHDGYSSDSQWQTGPYFAAFSPPVLGESGGVPSGHPSYYSFTHGNVHFVVLNSYDVSR
jgi:hypothetical protein